VSSSDPGMTPPENITEEAVAAAQLRLILDDKLGRATPAGVRRIAAMTGVEPYRESRDQLLTLLDSARLTLAKAAADMHAATRAEIPQAAGPLKAIEAAERTLATLNITMQQTRAVQSWPELQAARQQAVDVLEAVQPTVEAAMSESTADVQPDTAFLERVLAGLRKL